MARTSSSFLALLVTKVTGRHKVFQDGLDSFDLRPSWRCPSLSFLFLLFVDLIKGKRRIVGEVRERERKVRDVLRGGRVFIFIFYVYNIHLSRYSRALYLRLYSNILMFRKPYRESTVKFFL